MLTVFLLVLTVFLRPRCPKLATTGKWTKSSGELLITPLLPIAAGTYYLDVQGGPLSLSHTHTHTLH